MDYITVALISPLCSRFNGTRGGYCGAYSRGCYSDVRDARLCREFVKEGVRWGLVHQLQRGLNGQRKLINAEINKQFGPEFFTSLEEGLSIIFFHSSVFSNSASFLSLQTWLQLHKSAEK